MIAVHGQDICWFGVLPSYSRKQSRPSHQFPQKNVHYLLQHGSIIIDNNFVSLQFLCIGYMIEKILNILTN